MRAKQIHLPQNDLVDCFNIYIRLLLQAWQQSCLEYITLLLSNLWLGRLEALYISASVPTLAAGLTVALQLQGHAGFDGDPDCL